jgi:hypothetical protein
MATAGEVLSVMEMLAAAYPGKEIPNLPKFVHAAQRTFSEANAAALEAAALEAIGERKFFPTLAELNEEYRRVWNSWGRQDKTKTTPIEPFLAMARRLEWMRPEQWTAEDHAEFRQVMGRPVNWGAEDPNAPWMAWAIAPAPVERVPSTGGCIWRG